MNNGQYNFNEQVSEYSSKQRKELPVWVSPQYQTTRERAIKLIQTYEGLSESDFWILMRETAKGDKMAYMGLIISHKGCLKINASLDEKSKFKPDSVSLDKEGFNDSLVYTYKNAEQGIYEVGEISPANYSALKSERSSSYPYAMAFKRLFDRVVLKLSKAAIDGIYSDSEADEFKEPAEDTRRLSVTPITVAQIEILKKYAEDTGTKDADIFNYYKVESFEEMNAEQYGDCITMLIAKEKLNEQVDNAEK